MTHIQSATRREIARESRAAKRERDTAHRQARKAKYGRYKPTQTVIATNHKTHTNGQMPDQDRNLR